MTCACVDKNRGTGNKPRRVECSFCYRTRQRWHPHEACYVNRCSNPLILTDPPEWAFGNTRRATEGDSFTGAIIEGADYIAVRSCFCRNGKCKHFTESKQ